MIIHLVHAMFMFAVMVAMVAVLAGASVAAVVAVERWGLRHRERAVVREARRELVRDQVRRDRH